MSEDLPVTNGEFKGGVNARLDAIHTDLMELKGDVRSLWKAVNLSLERQASLATHVKILWGGFGFLIATIGALAIKVIFYSGPGAAS
jgi:hypothetical protein